MNALNSIDRQFDFLKRMRFLLGGSVHTDAFAIVDSILKETKLDSNLVYTWMKESYQNSQSNHISLENRFVEIKKDFIDHLDQQICRVGLYLMNQNKNIPIDSFWFSKASEVTDPWLSSSKNKLDSLRASLHINDILFAAKEILDKMAEKRTEFVEKELSVFIENSLPQYLLILPDATDEFKTKTMNLFNDLRTSIISGNTDLAHKQLKWPLPSIQKM